MPKSSGVCRPFTRTSLCQTFLLDLAFRSCQGVTWHIFFTHFFFFLLSIFADWPQTSVNRHLMFNLYFFLFTNGKAICTECLYLFALKNKGLIVGYDGGMSDSFWNDEKVVVVIFICLKSKKKDTNFTASPSFQGSSEDGGTMGILLLFCPLKDQFKLKQKANSP